MQTVSDSNSISIMAGSCCIFYQLGNCRKGTQCRFSHVPNNNSLNGPTLSDRNNSNASGRVGDNWVNAAEFVPKTSFSQTKCSQNNASSHSSNHLRTNNQSTRETEPNAQSGAESLSTLTRSREKTCGICFEIVMDKPDREQRFGILPNCNHCFCLTCIRKWRQAKQFDNKIIRACPECRVTSDYVCPSIYWVDAKDGKEKLLTDYKNALSLKHCKYFKQGNAKCPFGNKCFYLHALPDGTKTDVGPPQRQRRQNREAEIDMLQQIIIWDFLREQDNLWFFDLDELTNLSSTEDSDWSDYDSFVE